MKHTSRQCTYKIQYDLKVASYSWTKDRVNLHYDWISTFNKNERSLKMDFMHDHKLCSSTDMQVFFKYMSFKGYTSVPQQFLKGHKSVPKGTHKCSSECTWVTLKVYACKCPSRDMQVSLKGHSWSVPQGTQDCFRGLVISIKREEKLNICRG